MNEITYKVGDMFGLLPYGQQKPIILPHVCNDIGGWGAGFVIPLARKWPKAREVYLDAFEWKPAAWKAVTIGDHQLVEVEPKNENNGGIWVVNMVAQSGLRGADNTRPLRYNALVKCMESVKEIGDKLEKPEIHAPKFGSDLAGGNWDFISELITDIWLPYFSVTIYSLV